MHLALHPRPQTADPQPSTLNPQPATLNPSPTPAPDELQARLAFATRRRGKGGAREEAAALRDQLKPLETKQARLVVGFLQQASQEAGVRSAVAAAARCDSQAAPTPDPNPDPDPNPTPNAAPCRCNKRC